MKNNKTLREKVYKYLRRELRREERDQLFREEELHRQLHPAGRGDQ